jgi:hypothetical protein
VDVVAKLGFLLVWKCDLNALAKYRCLMVLKSDLEAIRAAVLIDLLEVRDS